MRLLPDAVWWVKADGVDVVSGLGESEWSGDVDLDAGKLKQMHDTYLKRLKSIRCIGLGRRMEHSHLQDDLAQLEHDLTDDITFLSSGNPGLTTSFIHGHALHKDCCSPNMYAHVIMPFVYMYLWFPFVALSDANDVYSRKQASGKATQQALFSLGWKVDELSKLTALGRKLLVRRLSIKERHASSGCNVVAENIPRKLTDLRSEAISFVEGCTRMRQTAATHLLVFMISPESRNKKPYAVPVQCIPYVGMSEDTIRGLANRLISVMTAKGMRVAGEFCSYHNNRYMYMHVCIHVGMVTNGEHNGLRVRGNTRPLHILRVRSEARMKVSRTSVSNLLAMLSPIGE